jgi:hypothetical protein
MVKWDIFLLSLPQFQRVSGGVGSFIINNWDIIAIPFADSNGVSHSSLQTQRSSLTVEFAGAC